MVNLPLFSRVLYIPSGDPNLPRILRFASMKLGGECWHFQRGGKPKVEFQGPKQPKAGVFENYRDLAGSVISF